MTCTLCHIFFYNSLQVQITVCSAFCPSAELIPSTLCFRLVWKRRMSSWQVCLTGCKYHIIHRPDQPHFLDCLSRSAVIRTASRHHMHDLEEHQARTAFPFLVKLLFSIMRALPRWLPTCPSHSRRAYQGRRESKMAMHSTFFNKRREDVVDMHCTSVGQASRLIEPGYNAG